MGTNMKMRGHCTAQTCAPRNSPKTFGPVSPALWDVVQRWGGGGGLGTRPRYLILGGGGGAGCEPGAAAMRQRSAAAIAATEPVRGHRADLQSGGRAKGVQVHTTGLARGRGGGGGIQVRPDQGIGPLLPHCLKPQAQRQTIPNAGRRPALCPPPPPVSCAAPRCRTGARVAGAPPPFVCGPAPLTPPPHAPGLPAPPTGSSGAALNGPGPEGPGNTCLGQSPSPRVGQGATGGHPEFCLTGEGEGGL